ncbi:MAG: AAA family ATPase [Phycisphaeraceae bacterium]|nr:AAA family ATPase [Phycisphaeraceae bacterium]QYK46958.1 MAG: AAA family ATPase [Phycisphaeraceae bacterium]
MADASRPPHTDDPATPEAVREAAASFVRDASAVREQIGRVIVGQRDVVEQVLVCLFASGHVLLEGVPGIGKTLLVRTLAQALSLAHGRVQFTPDLMPADITGTTIVAEDDRGDGRVRREFRFQPGPVFTQMLLADEINRATPKTQSALLEAMQERAVTVGGTSHPLPKPFFVMATQNPLEQEGTYPLPEAQLDRFFFKVMVGYATREEMSEILERTATRVSVEAEPVLDTARLLAHQALVRRVPIAPSVRDYAVRLVLSTHPRGKAAGPDGGRFATPMVNQYVRLGASPRAAQSLELGAKVVALLDGRAAVSVSDIQRIALPALRHRLIMNFEAEAEGVNADTVVENAIATLPVMADA